MTEINLLAIILAILPVIIIFLLLAVRHTPADLAGLIGWLVNGCHCLVILQNFPDCDPALQPGRYRCLTANRPGGRNINISGDHHAGNRGNCQDCRLIKDHLTQR